MKHCFTQWIKNLKTNVIDETPLEIGGYLLSILHKNSNAILGTKRMARF